ncbi:MAG: class I SAM-dependent methyltransferase [Anaerolineae bacterium]|nr:class I SAM-dependent methyltransferase [Anaerolineae bacterium]
MEKITDWVQLWRQLVELNDLRHKRGNNSDRWSGQARLFNDQVRKRWIKPDTSRDFILGQLSPDATFLDIGAGSGAWEVLLARRVRSITAVEPSPAMLEVLQETLQKEGLSHVRVVEGAWPDVDVETHDFSLASHAMYGCPDLPAYIRKMTAVTRRTCFMILRAPLTGSIMSLAAQHVLGQPYDSPNFVIAYNVMLQMGMTPNVLWEEPGNWEPWTSASLEEALMMMKARLGLFAPDERDSYLYHLLKERLVFRDDKYIWDRSVRSVLVYWQGGASR